MVFVDGVKRLLVVLFCRISGVPIVVINFVFLSLLFLNELLGEVYYPLRASFNRYRGVFELAFLCGLRLIETLGHIKIEAFSPLDEGRD